MPFKFSAVERWRRTSSWDWRERQGDSPWVDYLADLGCVATLRTLRLNDMNREALINELGQIIPVDQERLLRLVREQKRSRGAYPYHFDIQARCATVVDVVIFFRSSMFRCRAYRFKPERPMNYFIFEKKRRKMFRSIDL